MWYIAHEKALLGFCAANTPRKANDQYQGRYIHAIPTKAKWMLQIISILPKINLRSTTGATVPFGSDPLLGERISPETWFPVTLA
jgi:hypothetical protein